MWYLVRGVFEGVVTGQVQQLPQHAWSIEKGSEG